MHGIYAASPTRLSARAVLGGVFEGERDYGSVIMGLLRRRWQDKFKAEKREAKTEWQEMGELGRMREEWSLYGLQGGLQRLTDRLGEEVVRRGVDVKLGEKVIGLAVEQGRAKVSRA